jgi:hypothetical protein
MPRVVRSGGKPPRPCPAARECFAEPRDLVMTPRLSVGLQQSHGEGERVVLAPLAQQSFGREFLIEPQARFLLREERQ